MDQAQINTAITAAIDGDALAALKDYEAAATMPNTNPAFNDVEVVAKRLA